LAKVQRAVHAYQTAFGDQNAKLALALGNLGRYQTLVGNVSSGKHNAAEALAIARTCDDRPTLAACLYNMARSLSHPECVIEEVPYLREAASIYRDLGNNPVALADCVNRIACCLADASADLAESEKLYTQALVIYREHLDSGDLRVATGLFGLAQAQLKLGGPERAEPTIREAVNLDGRLLDPNHPGRLLPLELLSHVLILQGKWDEAETECRQGVQSSPTNAGFRAILAGVYARRGQWTEAADELNEAVRLDPSRVHDSFKLAVALLKAGKRNDYLQHCHQFQERFANTRELSAADKVAKVSLLLPVEGADFERACRLADFAATATEPSSLVPWMWLVKALAEMRRGHFGSANDWVTRVIDHNITAPQRKTSACFIQAVALASLGRIAEAQAALNAGDEFMKAHQDEVTGNFAASWYDWAIADILREEARSLIEDPSVPVHQRRMDSP
jgi:tetratricopeptide (TPR) repeat protein